MVDVRSTVNLALRKIGRLAAGREPRQADQTDALAALQGMYSAWIAAGAFGRLNDVVPTGSTYVAYGNERIYRESVATLSVTLPVLVSDEWYSDYGWDRRGYYGTTITVDTVGGNTVVTVEAAQPQSYARPPRDGAPVVISDQNGGETASWLYDATIHRWQNVTLLQLDDEAPRSAADPQGLAACLALEIADQFGAEVTPATMRQAQRFQAAMTVRYGMRREEDYNPSCYL